MPRVNVKYKFVKDALIDTVHEIEFQGVVAQYQNHRIAPNKYSGKVKNISVSNNLNIELRLSGIRDAKWTLEVFVTRIKKSGTDTNGNPIYTESGEEIKISSETIEGKIDSNNMSYYNKNHKITWG